MHSKQNGLSKDVGVILRITSYTFTWEQVSWNSAALSRCAQDWAVKHPGQHVHRDHQLCTNKQHTTVNPLENRACKKPSFIPPNCYGLVFCATTLNVLVDQLKTRRPTDMASGFGGEEGSCTKPQWPGCPKGQSVTVLKVSRSAPISPLVGRLPRTGMQATLKCFVVRVESKHVIGKSVLFFLSLSPWCPYFLCFSLIIVTPNISGIFVNKKIVHELGKSALFCILLRFMSSKIYSASVQRFFLNNSLILICCQNLKK